MKDSELEGQQDFLDDHSPERIEANVFAFEQISEIEDKVSVSFYVERSNKLFDKLLNAFKHNNPIEISVFVDEVEEDE